MEIDLYGIEMQVCVLYFVVPFYPLLSFIYMRGEYTLRPLGKFMTICKFIDFFFFCITQARTEAAFDSALAKINQMADEMEEELKYVGRRLRGFSPPLFTTKFERMFVRPYMYTHHIHVHVHIAGRTASR